MAYLPVGVDENNKLPVAVATALADSILKATTQAQIRTLIDAASPAQIAAAVNAVINAAPGALDTLNELAAAMGDDPNFAATLTGLIGAKYTKPGTGIPSTDLTSAAQAALTKAASSVDADFVTAAVGDKLIVARHGSNQTFARPVTSSTVLWIGTATPANRLANDLVFYVAATPVDPWTPAAVAGLHSWYDAISLGMLDAERVSQWNDRSPSPLNMTQATAAQQPTYVAAAINGMPAVRFDGTSWNMRGPTFAAYVGAWTVYMVATSSPASLTGSSDAFFDGAGASNAMLRLLYGRNTNGEWNPNRGVGFSAAGANNSPHVHRIVFNGANSSVEIDGVTAGTGTTSLGGIDVTQLVLGMRGDSAQYLDGYLGELIFIKGTVPAEDAQIKEYLRTRWRFAA